MKDYEREKISLVAKQLNIFQNDILNKLLMIKNIRKDVWKHESTEYLFKRLLEEVEELKIEINNSNYMIRHITIDNKIVSECADIAAFAMMIADRQRLKNDYKRKFIKKAKHALENMNEVRR